MTVQTLALRTPFKKVYQLIPFKKQLYSAIKKYVEFPEHIYRHLHFKSDFQVKTGSSESFRIFHYGNAIENDLFWRGFASGWEGTSLALWVKLARRSTTIIDIGANTGVYALSAKSVNPAAHVIAFEPADRVRDKLEKNIKLNGYDIVSEHYAISDKPGEAVFYDTDTVHTYSASLNANMLQGDPGRMETRVETTLLDDYLAANNITNVNLIKIDAEMHEPQVIAGAAETIRTQKPSILIEILNSEIAEAVQSQTEPLGYQFYRISENKSVTLVDEITPAEHRNYLLCTPETALDIGLNDCKTIQTGD